MRKAGAYRIYLVLEGATALLMAMIFTASSVYQVTVVGLTPLQLVLVGTTLEAAVFLFEIPTGIVADVYSRRLSVIVGMALIGLGFLLEGSFPVFWLILLGQALWGLGYTFTSGATQAWISDEIGEAAAGRAFLRANQVGNLSALAGIGAGILIGSLRVSLPIQLGGAGMMFLGLFMAWKMPETGFKPAPREGRSADGIHLPWASMKSTFLDGLGMVRRRPALMTILSIGLIYGLYSEGFDRLWTKHLIDQFSLPLASADILRPADGLRPLVQPVVWIGLLRAAGLLLSTGAAEIVARSVDTTRAKALVRALFLFSLLLVLGMFTFALAGAFWLAIAAYLLIDISRDLIGPVYTAWVNQRLDSRVRATVISMSGQVDAIGQIAGGPFLGVIGSAVSVRAALVSSSLILTPVLALYRLAVKGGEHDGLSEESVEEPDDQARASEAS